MPALSSVNDFSSPASTEVVSLTQSAVSQLAQRAGFLEAGIVGIPYEETVRDAKRFTGFIEAGRHGSMEYLARRNDKNELIRSRIDVPFPWVRTAIVCLAGYNADAPLSISPAEAGSGWIARYAWSGQPNQKGAIRPADYHKVLLKRLHLLEAEMHTAFGEFESRAYVDTGPLVERSAASAAGLGWTAKNTCLIHPKLGSWNFLAVLLTSLPLSPENAPMIVPDRCGSCRRCIEACPTRALDKPYQMDATRCISYLTIEHRGEISEDLSAGMGRQIFGCDICQDVCPWNRKAPIGISDGPTGAHGMLPRGELINPDLEWLADLDLAGFERLFNGSPVRRTGFIGLRRNIAIAMGNSGLRRFLPWLKRWSADESEIDPESTPNPATGRAVPKTALRNAALWALNRIEQISARREQSSQ